MKKLKPLLTFMFVSFLWIFGTNYLIEEFVSPSYYDLFNRGKEAFYVVVTGCFFFFYVMKSEELDTAKEEEKRLSTLINSMVDFVNFKDGDGRWIEANKFGLKLFQLENVDYRGKKDSELAEYTEFYGDALRYCEISDEETWKKGVISRIEEEVLIPDGSTKTFDTLKVPLFHPDGSRKGLVVIGRDITDQKHVKNLLEESEQRYKSLFEYNPDIVYMIDIDGIITNLNPQYENITGFSVEETIGQHIKDILPRRSRMEISSIISSVISEKQPKTFELGVTNKAGNKIVLNCASVPMIINGKIAGIVGYAKDITQIRETEERLRRTEKLSVVGELSASVAHEIRNPLTSLKGFVQLLKMEDEKHQSYYQIMLDELNRINHIVGELLLLAKPQRIQYTKADIQTILYDVISLLKTEASLHNIQIDFEFLDKKLEIECEPNQLKQLFINLIKNAIEASASGDTVLISIELSNEENVVVKVKDNGCGISDEFLKRLGEPFYSSKEKGTGLGLTVSFKIVESHNGDIRFNSLANQGTEVLVELPMSNNHKNSGEKTVKI
ncbi:PAS domain S-box protein [Mesobacillus foraminis]|uniref:PAS domain S-box protein n=1 Tax=Mesobacillus foraminis TaxID=279826 RepID=UPI001BE64B38|nr:PAS domain-containing sensor histidine kinase [Mesobacillus foraminis]MBT2758698.1 PAS domain S-box protein [Mesobacillus foraminis]